MNQSKVQTWIGRVLSILVVLPFVPSAGMKLMAKPQVLEGMAKMGLPASLIWPLGIVELACVILYLIPGTAVIGAILLTGYLGGAMLTHLRIGEPVYLHIVMGVAIWAGIWLRDPRLRQLMPWRNCAA